MDDRRAIPARPFAFPHEGALDPARTALVAIDLQIDFLSEEGYFARIGHDVRPLRAILPNVARLIGAARSAGCRIVHTRQGYRADLADMTPYEHWRRRRLGLEGTTVLLRASPGFGIVPEVPAAADDIVIDKTANGAFVHTDLEHVLRAQGITHLIFAGVTTDVCVHSTVREAADRNFACLVVADACASGDARAHEAALDLVTVEDGLFGVVAETDVVLGTLARIVGAPANAPSPARSRP
jgi:nicotinamidase-related amidase